MEVSVISRIICLLLLTVNAYGASKTIKNNTDKPIEVVFVPLEASAEKIKFTVAPHTSESRNYQGWGLETIHYRIAQKEWLTYDLQNMALNQFSYFQVTPSKTTIILEPDFKTDQKSKWWLNLVGGLILLFLGLSFIFEIQIRYSPIILLAASAIIALNIFEFLIVASSSLFLMIATRYLMNAEKMNNAIRWYLLYPFLIVIGAHIMFVFNIFKIFGPKIGIIFLLMYLLLFSLLAIPKTRALGAYVTAAFYVLLATGTIFGHIPTLSILLNIQFLFYLFPALSAIGLGLYYQQKAS